MQKDQSKFIFGGLLILAGILFLLQEFQILGNAFEFLWIILMAAGGSVFLWVYFSKKDQWWAVIPGLALVGLALVGLQESLDLLPGSNWTGAVFLGCLGLAFWLVYLRRPEQWWAMIPGGVLLTLTLVTGLDDLVSQTEVVFFLGLGVTFFLVALLPNAVHNTRWALIPGGILTVLGLVMIAQIGNIMNIVFPVILVGLGIFILVKTISR